MGSSMNDGELMQALLNARDAKTDATELLQEACNRWGLQRTLDALPNGNFNISRPIVVNPPMRKKPPLIYIERWIGEVHIWVGRLGLHLFWPKFWHSQWDFVRKYHNNDDDS